MAEENKVTITNPNSIVTEKEACTCMVDGVCNCGDDCTCDCCVAGECPNKQETCACMTDGECQCDEDGDCDCCEEEALCDCGCENAALYEVLHDDRDDQAENLVRWGAARAGAIVMAPLLGNIALMANEVYMISRLAKVYDVKISDRAIMGFMGAFGARVVGRLAVTLIPIPGIALPVAVSVTYGIGKVAQAWIKDGMPIDVKPYVEKFDDLKEEGRSKVAELKDAANKNIALGDEGVDFTKKTCPIKKGAAKVGEKAGGALNTVLLKLGMSQEEIDDKKATTQSVLAVTKEVTESLAADLCVAVKGYKEDAKVQAQEFKLVADEKAAELKEKAEELKEKAAEKAEELKEKAAEKAEEVKEKAEEVKEKAAEKAEEVKEKAAEAKTNAPSIKDLAAEKAEAIKDKAAQVKADAQATREAFKQRVEEKKADYQKSVEPIVEDKVEDEQ